MELSTSAATMKERRRHRIGIRSCGIKKCYCELLQKKAQACESWYTGYCSSIFTWTTTMGYDDSEIKK